MTFGEYALGLLALAGFVVPLALAAAALRRRLLPGWSGAPAALASAIATLALIVLVSEAIGVVGGFRIELLAPAAIVCAALVWAGLRRLPSATAEVPPGPAPSPGPVLWSALAAALLVIGQWGAGTLNALDRGMTAADTIWYHLPFAARFTQTDSLADLHYVEIEPLTAYFPLNAELVHAIGIAAFDRDVLSPFVNLGFVGLALLAGWCIGRPWGVAPLSLIGASIALSIPVFWGINAGQAGNDIVGVAFFVSAAALMATARGRGPGMAFAAVAAGLAVGTKLSMLAPVAALTLAALVVAPAGRRLRYGALWVAGLAATGGFWYVRNVVHTGSPLPWLDVKAGPLEWEAPPRGLTEDYEYSVVHYLTDTGIWTSHFRPGLNWAFGEVWFVVIALAAVGVVGAIAARGDLMRRALGGAALLCGLAYLVTPNSAAGPEGDPWGFGLNSRYAVAGVALALAMLPTWSAVGRERVRAGLAFVLGAVLVATLVSDTGVWSYRRDDALAVAAAVGIVVACGIWLARARRPLVAYAAAVAALVALVVGGGYAVARGYLEDRYRVERGSESGAWFRDLRDARIGVLGAYAHYPLYGPDLSNEVVFLGRRGDNGAFTRLRTCREWRAAVGGADFDYVQVVPVVSPNVRPTTPKSPPRELAWTAGDPAATEVFRTPVSGVFRIDGRLSPERC